MRRRKWRLAASAAVCVTISACYCWQPDWLAPFTLVPAWCWLVPAIALTGYGISGRHKLWSVAVLTLWAVANPRAAAEVLKWKPDIVLLQESPSRRHLDRLSRELFEADGTSLWGGDTAILAKGHIQRHEADHSSHFVHATVVLPNDLSADVISVRLSPLIFRLDFWMRGFWIDHRNKRIRHRQQILEAMQPIRTTATPLIVGGDFNAPPGDAALAPLRERLYDTFRVAGIGWGSTGTNHYPLFRVDQIWVSRHFRAESVTAQKTIHSDHRMVLCDLIVE